jgi:hypothetical protein
LRRSAAYVGGPVPALPFVPSADGRVVAAPPRARAWPGPAAAHGAHTMALRTEFVARSTIQP